MRKTVIAQAIEYYCSRRYKRNFNHLLKFTFAASLATFIANNTYADYGVLSQDQNNNISVNSPSGNAGAINGGSGNVILNTDSESNISGGTANTIIGGQNLNINGSQNNLNTLLGGNNNTIDADNNGNTIGDSAIIAGQNNDIKDNSLSNAIIGGNNNTVGDSNATTTQRSVILGGDHSVVTGIGSAIIAGSTNRITNAGSTSSIVGGQNNIITGTGDPTDNNINSMSIIGGAENQIDEAGNTGIFSGYKNTIGENATNSVIIGGINGHIGANAHDSVSIAGGIIAGDTDPIPGATRGNNGYVRVGKDADGHWTVTADAAHDSIAIGRESSIFAPNSIAIGAGSQANMMMGNPHDDKSGAVVALGFEAKAQSSNDVAIGSYSVAQRTTRTIDKVFHEAGPNPQTHVRDTVFGPERMFGNDKSDILASTSGLLGAVAVGAPTGSNGKEKTRQITHVAAGGDLTDAVNVAQLGAVAHFSERGFDITADKANTTNSVDTTYNTPNKNVINGDTINFTGKSGVITNFDPQQGDVVTSTTTTLTQDSAGNNIKIHTVNFDLNKITDESQITADETHVISAGAAFNAIKDSKTTITTQDGSGLKLTPTIGEGMTGNNYALGLDFPFITDHLYMNYKVNNTGNGSVSLAHGLDFTGDNNVTIKDGSNGEIQFSLNKNISVEGTVQGTTIQAGNNQLNANGLTVNKVTGLATNQIDNTGNPTNGATSADAVSIGSLTSYVGNKLAGQTISYSANGQNTQTTTLSQGLDFQGIKDQTEISVEKGGVVKIGLAQKLTDTIAQNTVVATAAQTKAKENANKISQNTDDIGKVTKIATGAQTQATTNAEKIKGNTDNLTSMSKTLDTLHSAADKGIEFTTANGTKTVKLGEKVNVAGDSNIKVSADTNGLHINLNKDLTLENVTASGSVVARSIAATKATLGNIQINGNKITGLSTKQFDNTGKLSRGITDADAVSIGSLTSYVGNKLAGQTISYSANGQNAQTTTLSKGLDFQGSKDQTEISVEKGGVVKIGLAQKLTNTIAQNTAAANTAKNTANTNAKNISNNVDSIAKNTNSISDNSKNLANLSKTLDTLHSSADKGIEFTTANGTKTVKLGEQVNVAGDSNIKVSVDTHGLNISLNKDLNVDNITATNTVKAENISTTTISASNGATLGQIHINGNKVTGLATNQIDNTGNPTNGATSADAVSIGSLTSYVGNKLAGQTISYSANGQNTQTTTLSKGLDFQGIKDQTEISVEKGGVVKIGLAQKLTDTIAQNTVVATAAQTKAKENANKISQNTDNISKVTKIATGAQTQATTNAEKIKGNTDNLTSMSKTLETLHSAADKGVEFTTTNGTKTVKLGEKVNVAGDSNIQVSANTSGLNISLNKDLNIDSITAKNTVKAENISATTISASNGATLGQIHINGNKVTGLATNQIDNTGNPTNGATSADAVSIGSLTSYVGNKLAGQTISYSANGQNAQTTTLSQGLDFQGIKDQTEISVEKGGVVKIGLAQKLTDTIAQNTAAATAAQTEAKENANKISQNTDDIGKVTKIATGAQTQATTNAEKIKGNTDNLTSMSKTLETLHSSAEKGIEFTTTNGTKTVKLGDKVKVTGDSNIQVSANTSGLNISLNKDLNVDSITAKNTVKAGTISATTISASNGATLGQIHINGNKVTGLATNQIDNTGNPTNGATSADAVSIGSLTSYVGNKLAGQTISYSANGQNTQTTTLSKGLDFQGIKDQTEISVEKGGVVKIGLAQKLTDTIAQNTAVATAAQTKAKENANKISQNTDNIGKVTKIATGAKTQATTNAEKIKGNTDNLTSMSKTLDTLHSAADKGIEFTTANGTKTVKLGDKVKVAGDSNIQVSANTNGLNISLNKDLNVDNITAKNTVKAGTISTTTISASNGATLGQIHINGNKVTGLSTNQIDNTGNPANGATAADAVSIGSLTSYVGNKLAGQTISYSANGQNAQTTTLSKGLDFQSIKDQTEISTEKGGVVKIGLAQKLTDTIAQNTVVATAAQTKAKENANKISQNTDNISKVTKIATGAQTQATTNAEKIKGNTDNLASMSKTLETLHSSADKGIEFTTTNGTKTVKLGEQVNVAGDSNIKVSADTNGLHINLNKDLTLENVTASGSVVARSIAATQATLGNIHINGNQITGLPTKQFVNGTKAPGVNDADAVSIGSLTSYVSNKLATQTIRGLTFAGNTGKTKIELGNIINIKGASTPLKSETQGANNISVTASSNGLAITLNPKVTVDGLTAKSVIIKSGGKVTGLATNQDFTNTQDAQDAASVGSVKNYVDQVLTGDKGIANEKLTFTDGKNSTSIKLGGSVNVSGDSNINVNTKNGIHISLNKNVAVNSLKAGTNSFSKDGLTANKISGNILEGTTIKGTTITASNGKLTSILTSSGLTAPKVTITNGGTVTGLSTTQFTNGSPAKGVNNADAVSIGSVISYVGSKLANQTISYGANGQKNNQTTTFSKGFNFQQTDGETTVSVAPNGVVKIGLNQVFKQQVNTNTSDIKDLQEQVTKDNQSLHAAIDKTNQAVAQNAKDIKTNKANTDKAIDENKTAIGENKSAIGENKTTIGENKTAIGENKSAIGENKTAIGENKSAIGENKTAIGENKSAIGENKTAIGENKSAIGENKTAIGENKSAIGENKTAIGENKSAIGENKTAIGENKSAIGENKTAIGENKSAIGENKTAIGENKSAIGENKTTIGENKTAIGENKSAIGENKTAIGENKSAIGENKTAIGENKSAIGENKTAIGENKSAIGENKTAIGENKSAIGENKTAIGENKSAIGENKTAIGENKSAIGENKTAIGENKSAIGENKTTIGENKTAIGENKSAIGENKTAIGENKSAIGENKTAIGENKSAIGENKTAIGENKSAIGENKTAIGENKSAIGENKTAIGENKSAIGENKTAIGENKTAIGENKTAIGENKSAIGENKTAIGENKSAIGENKTAIGENKTAIGENKTAIGENKTAIGENKTAIGENKTAIGENKTAISENKSAIGENKTAIGENKSAIGENKTAIGANKSAIGENKTAIGENKSAIGENKTAIGENKSAIGENKTAIGENKSAIGENKTAIGENKSAIGENKTAIGENKSAIGENKTAIGENKSAIGENKTAIGENKSAIGENKTAIGENKSAIGENKTAIGANKSAIGENKTAIGENKSAIGENKTAIGANKSAIGENKTAIGENKSAISENKTAIGANKSAIGDNKTAIGKNASTIGENKSAISTNKTAIAGNTSAIAANKKATAEEINALKNQVGKNNGNLQTQINQNKQSSSKNAKAIEDNKTAAKIAEQNLQNQITQNQKSNTDRYSQLHGLIVNNQGKITHVENTIKQSNITIAKGLNFSGDQGKTVNRQLGETFNINGDKQNISTTTTANGVEVKLNDDVKVKHSLTVGNNTVINDTDGVKTNRVMTGNTTMDSNGVRVQDHNGASASVSAKQGVVVRGHNGSQVTIKSNSIGFNKDHHGTIHNVDVDVNDPTSVATVGYVNKAMMATAAANQALNHRMDELDHRVNKMNKDLRGGVASAIAMSFLQIPAQASQSMISAAVGTYRSQQAIAVGYGRRSDDGKMSFKVGFSVNTRKDLGAGAGIGYAW